MRAVLSNESALDANNVTVTLVTDLDIQADGGIVRTVRRVAAGAAARVEWRLKATIPANHLLPTVTIVPDAAGAACLSGMQSLEE